MRLDKKVEIKECDDKYIQNTIAEMTHNTVKAAISEKNGQRGEGVPKIYSLPVFECKYSDGTPMYTYAVILYEEGDDVKDDFPAQKLEKYDWFPQEDKVYEIKVPALTHKEVNAINQFLPQFSVDEISNRLPFIERRYIKQYVSIWRYYPRFFEIGEYV